MKRTVYGESMVVLLPSFTCSTSELRVRSSFVWATVFREMFLFALTIWAFSRSRLSNTIFCAGTSPKPFACNFVPANAGGAAPSRKSSINSRAITGVAGAMAVAVRAIAFMAVSFLPLRCAVLPDNGAYRQKG